MNLHYLSGLKPKVQKRDNKYYIFDVTRKKYVLLTPEEWVRQHFVHYLLHDLSYPLGLIQLEQSVKTTPKVKRTDILVYDVWAQPYMVVECKAAYVSIDRQALAQISYYNSHLKAPFLVLTNGLIHYSCRMDYEKNKGEVLHSIPKFSRPIKPA